MKDSVLLRAAYIDNGITGLSEAFSARETVSFTPLSTDRPLPNLANFDLLIVPNGSDQVFMSHERQAVLRFLNTGGSLFCFDGFFGDWLPDYKWKASPETETKKVRYKAPDPNHPLLKEVDIQDLVFHEGISGWWACGFIETTNPGVVVLEDTWSRPVMIWDDRTYRGYLFLTASGPVGDYGYTGSAPSRLLENGLNLLKNKKPWFITTQNTAPLQDPALAGTNPTNSDLNGAIRVN